MFDLAAYASQWPLASLGGLFVLAMGIAVILGSPFNTRRRMLFVWLGFVAGLGAIAYGVSQLGINPPPTRFQALSLIVAIVVELAGFTFLMPRLWRKGEREAVAGTLMIVGVHFVVMWPAFGPMMAVLGGACAANGAVARRTKYPLGLAWFIDGALKLGFGALMAWSAIDTI